MFNKFNYYLLVYFFVETRALTMELLAAVIASVSFVIIIVFVGIALVILVTCLLRRKQWKNTRNTKYAMKQVLCKGLIEPITIFNCDNIEIIAGKIIISVLNNRLLWTVLQTIM